MRTSENGISLIKRFEGLELEAYQDIAGVWTIGYGHTGSDVEPGMRISEREAEELLKRDLKPRENAVDRLTNVSLNQNEFDALVSFVYNVGENAYKNSTARRRLNNKDRVGAAEALTWWNKATVNGVLREVTGLTRRRAAERALFLEPVNPPIVNDNDQVAENSRVTPVEDAPRRPNLAESRSIQGATVAGGAGIAASTMGRDSADELDQLEENIETGEGMTVEGDGSDIGEEAPADSGDAPQPDLDPDEDLAGGEPVDPDSGDADEGAAETGESDGASSDIGATDDGETTVPNDSIDLNTSVQSIETGPERPSKHEKHAVESQVQLALLVLFVLAVLYIVLARIDDWWRFRR